MFTKYIKNKKIGMLTFHNPNNFGAMLQAYALQKLLKNKGYDVEIMDYRLPRIENFKKLFYFKLYKNHSIYLFLRRTLSDIVFFPLNYMRNKKFDEFMNRYMNLSEIKYKNYEDLKSRGQEYDIYIVGSDLVWNPEAACGVNPIYFLDFVINAKKISYASSIGDSKISLENKIEYKKYINNLDYISVREKTAADLLQNITDKPIINVLDPTLLLSKQEWNVISKKPKIKEKYILVYMVESTPNFIEIVNKISLKTGLKVVQFSRKTIFNNEIKRAYISGPLEFIGYIEEAEIIITNSFHGVVFSIINEKNFYTVPHSTRGSRMVDLLNILGINDRIIYKPGDITDLPCEIDYNIVNTQLEQQKKYSFEYLEKSINS